MIPVADVVPRQHLSILVPRSGLLECRRSADSPQDNSKPNLQSSSVNFLHLSPVEEGEVVRTHAPGKPQKGAKIPIIAGFDVARTGVASVGFIGFPSVGKSTLMSRLTGQHSEGTVEEQRLKFSRLTGRQLPLMSLRL